MRGRSLMGVMAELAEYAIYTSDKQQLDQMLESVGADQEVAFVSVEDMRGRVLSERRFAAALANVRLPALAAGAAETPPGEIHARMLPLEGQRYIELVALVANPRSSARALAGIGNGAEEPVSAPHAAPVRLIRLGVSLEPQRKQFREQMVGAHRRGRAARGHRHHRLAAADAPAGGADAPAHARGARRGLGAARRLRAGQSADELGLLTHTFNHMTQKLAAVAVARSRTTSARSRRRWRSARASWRSPPRTPTSSRSTTSSPACRTGRCSTSG